MADVKFLANLDIDGNIDLNQGQLQSASFQVLTADPTSGNFEGRMIYRSDTDVIKYYDGSAWQALSTTTGDITAVTAGDGLGGGGTSGAVTLSVNVDDATIAISSDTVQAKTEAVTDGGTALATGGQIHTFVTGQGYLTAHPTISGAASSVDNSNRTYIQDITLDSNGHVTGITSATETVTNTFRTVTAGGNTLGASETLAFTAGTNVTITESAGAVTINATDTNTQLSDEQVQDIVGAMFSSNTETNITATYQDTDGTIDLVVSQRSDESIQDLVGAMFSSNTETNITATYQDADGTIDLVVAANSIAAGSISVSDDTDNSAQPLVFVEDAGNGRGLRVDGTGTNDLTYNPSTQTLSVNNITVAGTQTINNTQLINTSNGVVFEGATENAFETSLVATDPTQDRTITLKDASGTLAFTSDITYTSDEQIEDIVGAMVSSNTETGITVTYQDADGTLDFVVDTATSSANGIGRVSAGDGIDVSVSSGNFTVSAEDSTASNKGVVIVAAGAGIDVSYSSGTATVSGETATDSNAGIVELATPAEALAGTDSTRAVTAEGLAARSFTTTIGDGTATSIDVTHNLGTRNVIVQMYDSSSYETVYAEVSRTSTSAINCRFNTAPTSGDITVLITKVD